MRRRIENIPVVDRGLRHQTKACLAVPLPEHNVLRHHRGLKLLLCLQVEDLEGFSLCFERDDVLVPVHNCTVGIDGTFDDFIVVFEIDDYDLSLVLISNLLPYADEVIRF